MALVRCGVVWCGWGRGGGWVGGWVGVWVGWVGMGLGMGVAVGGQNGMGGEVTGGGEHCEGECVCAAKGGDVC